MQKIHHPPFAIQTEHKNMQKEQQQQTTIRRGSDFWRAVGVLPAPCSRRAAATADAWSATERAELIEALKYVPAKKRKKMEGKLAAVRVRNLHLLITGY